VIPRRALVALVGIGFFAPAGCGPEADAPLGPPPSAAELCAGLPEGRPASSPAWEADEGAAARRFGVPLALLRAVAQVESGRQNVLGQPEVAGQPVARGPWGLTPAQLDHAAGALRLPRSRLEREVPLQAYAAAWLLRQAAGSTAVDADWAAALARFRELPTAAGRGAYVAEVLRRAGEPVPLAVAAVASASATTGAADYAGAVWRASPNFNARPNPADVHLIVIHSCEGSYVVCWSWLTNPAARASAHYVVREDGSEISQLVHERDRAWHVAARYECARNGGHDCERNGQSINDFSIGIENAGFASQPMWPRAQLDASARLVCDITRRWGIPRDRYHIVGHAQLQPADRTDPGSGWPWTAYVACVRAACGEY